MVKDSETDKDKVLGLLRICHDSLHSYGKTPEQLTNATFAFLMVLGEYEYKEVERAFTKYLSKESTVPTPADIVNIIEPKPEWCSLTVKIIREKMSEGSTYVTNQERRYVEEYLKFKINSYK